MISGQEMERVYSYNPAARTGPMIVNIILLLLLNLNGLLIYVGRFCDRLVAKHIKTRKIM